MMHVIGILLYLKNSHLLSNLNSFEVFSPVVLLFISATCYARASSLLSVKVNKTQSPKNGKIDNALLESDGEDSSSSEEGSGDDSGDGGILSPSSLCSSSSDEERDSTDLKLPTNIKLSNSRKLPNNVNLTNDMKLSNNRKLPNDVKLAKFADRKKEKKLHRSLDESPTCHQVAAMHVYGKPECFSETSSDGHKERQWNLLSQQSFGDHFTTSRIKVTEWLEDGTISKSMLSIAEVRSKILSKVSVNELLRVEIWM